MLRLDAAHDGVILGVGNAPRYTRSPNHVRGDSTVIVRDNELCYVFRARILLELPRVEEQM